MKSFFEGPIKSDDEVFKETKRMAYLWGCLTGVFLAIGAFCVGMAMR